MRPLTNFASLCLSLLDPTTDKMKCLSMDYHTGTHVVTIQIEPTGIISRLSLLTDRASNFSPSSDNPPSVQPTAAPIEPDSMLTRLDRLCESLGDTLREVVIAIFPWSKADFETLQADPVKLMRGLRDQMPVTSARGRLSFRVVRDRYYGEYLDATRDVFVRDGKYWKGVTVDD